MKSSFTSFRFLFICTLVSILLSGQGCNLSRRLPPGSRLVDKVKIKGEPPGYDEDLYRLVKQKPNKKILGLFRYNLWSYYRFYPRRLRRLDKLRTELAESKNELSEMPVEKTRKRKRLVRHIKVTERKVSRKQRRIDNLLRSVWEEPVLLDSSLIDSGAAQMRAYLFNSGYFHSKVNYKIRIKRFKARINYSVDPGASFSIQRLDYYIFDKRISDIVLADTAKRLFNPGDRYNGNKLAEERDRLTYLLRDNGYYNFSREYIYYEVDSNLDGNIVNVGLGIANPDNGSRHKIYRIQQIVVEPEYILGKDISKDTSSTQGILFLSNDLKVRKEVLAQYIFFRKGALYKATDYQYTINRLSQLSYYKFVDIQFEVDTSRGGDTAWLNCFIHLTPFVKQEIRFDLELNSTEQNQAQQIFSTRTLGVAAGISYTNRNIAHRALQLEVKPRGSVEIPITFLQDTRVIDTPSYQYGLSNTLTVPKLLAPRLPKWLKLISEDRRQLSSSTINLNTLYENNRFYLRKTANINLTWLVPGKNFRLYITPIEISYVNTDFTSQVFEERIKATGDPLLLNLFDKHIITDFRVTYFNGKQPLGLVNYPVVFFRDLFEFGGFASALVDVLLDSNSSKGTYTGQIGSINYFQYVKNEADIRFYFPIFRSSNIALRALVGTGAPFGNSDILPFEKRFYVGGANSIRAWRLRTLGPGTFSDPTGLKFDRSGDVRLEANGELRFPIYGVFQAALFGDIGNVWTYKPDGSRPGAQFGYNTFYRELAIGTGIGIRLDFSFFIFRTDLAIPVRDPSLPVEDRTVIRNIGDSGWLASKTVLQFGIGYPF